MKKKTKLNILTKVMLVIQVIILGMLIYNYIPKCHIEKSIYVYKPIEHQDAFNNSIYEFPDNFNYLCTENVVVTEYDYLRNNVIYWHRLPNDGVCLIEVKTRVCGNENN